ncbi:MAG: spondin domain-containing protein [Gemmatimonadetes bacterium]|nr:spondin domain-containing protein [Gemmatimonadota bacterium]
MKNPSPSLALLALLTFAACDDEEVVAPVTETMFEVRVENVSTVFDYAASGSFAIPSGTGAAGALLPGAVYEFEFSATPGSKLSFATMFVQSNDLFFAPSGAGIELFYAQSQQITGDVTNQIMPWDAGAEADQEPGLGSDQAPRQAGANTGAADGNATV